MGALAVHEFIALDGVFENPSWTFEFAPTWSTRTAADDPTAPFFNDA